MKYSFYDAVEKRRSIYAIGKDDIVGRNRIRELVEFSVKHVPTPFNSQSGRVVLLFGKESSEFWDITRECLRKIVAPKDFSGTAEKIAGFDAGFGTVLFFEDQKIVEGLQAQFPLYRDKFPLWSLQSNGMLEYAIWIALEGEGLGASLQHYNPLVDEEVKRRWNLPSSWKLLAEMPFGSVVSPAGAKTYLPVSERVMVFE